MRSITNANFSCQAGRGGWGREARIENPRSLAEVEAISNNVERSPEDWSLKMIAQEAVAVLASKKRTLELLATDLRTSPE
jgi:flagellar biosynthesis chaperone FliJ